MGGLITKEQMISHIKAKLAGKEGFYGDDPTKTPGREEAGLTQKQWNIICANKHKYPSFTASGVNNDVWGHDTKSNTRVKL